MCYKSIAMPHEASPVLEEAHAQFHHVWLVDVVWWKDCVGTDKWENLEEMKKIQMLSRTPVVWTSDSPSHFTVKCRKFVLFFTSCQTKGHLLADSM